MYVTAPATAALLALVSLILVVFIVVALAGPEKVTRIAVLVGTCVWPGAGDEDATDIVPVGVVTGAVLLPDEQPVISAPRIVSEARVTLK